MFYGARCGVLLFFESGGTSVIEIQGDARRTCGAENDISPGYFPISAIGSGGSRACTVSRLRLKSTYPRSFLGSIGGSSSARPYVVSRRQPPSPHALPFLKLIPSVEFSPRRFFAHEKFDSPPVTELGICRARDPRVRNIYVSSTIKRILNSSRDRVALVHIARAFLISRDLEAAVGHICFRSRSSSCSRVTSADRGDGE